MKELIIFISIALFVTTPIVFLILRLFFKKSFLVNISIGILIVTLVASIISYIIAVYGTIHFIWGAPTSIFVGILTILRLQKDIKVLQKLRDNLEKISNLDINVKFEEKHTKRKDEFGDISKLMQKITAHLNKIINQIKISSYNLKDASNQLSINANQITQSTNEQSATTEEISSSMEQILVSIDSNSKNSLITSKKSEESSEDLLKGSKIILRAIDIVSKISKEISIISEIADKTDILAINAGIESSHAGEFGRSFAIVAQEIRKLSEKSKEASKRIKILSKTGKSSSELTRKVLNKALPQISTSTDLMKNIAIASQEQNLSASSINDSILQLTEITNQNSASAEQMSVSAEQLLAQAEQLEQIINLFNTKSTEK